MGKYERLTRAELIAALAFIESRQGTEDEFKRLVHELRVHQDELEMQNRELRQTRQLHEESRNRYAQLYDFSPAGCVTLDRSGCIREINLTAAALLGRPRPFLVGKPFADCVEKQDIGKFFHHLQVCRQGRPKVATEIALQAQDGPVQVELTSAGDPCHENDESLFHTAIIDITERKRAEFALRESENKYRQLIEQASDGIFIADQVGKLVLVNSRGCEMLGYTKDELLGLSMGDTYPPGEGEKFLDRFEELRAGASLRFERQMRRKDGTLFPVEVAVKMLDDGRFQGIVRDVTERLRASEKVRATQERMDFLMSATPAVIYACEPWPPYAATFVSDNIRAQMGYEPREFIDPPGFWLEKVHPEDLQRVLDDLPPLFERRHHVYEYRFRHQDGTYRWVRDEVRLICREDGTRREIVGSWIDISARKQAEEELKLSHERLRQLTARVESLRETERTRIAREIHDELAATLSAIKMDLSWCRKAIAAAQIRDVDERIRSAMDITDSAIGAVRRICTDLRPSILDNIGLLAAIEWQAQDMEKRTGIECEVVTNVHEAELKLDPDRATGLFRIVQEALTNVARHSVASRVRIAVQAGADAVNIEVEDNGRGIAAEQSVGRESWGILGMSERARSLGGRFEISGVPGRGTTVSVHIPRGK